MTPDEISASRVFKKLKTDDIVPYLRQADKISIGGNDEVYLDGSGNYSEPKYPSLATSQASGLMPNTDKQKLDGIAANANNYTLPTATNSVLGGVKITAGNGLANASGTVSMALASVSAAGAMSAADKTKLDGLGGAATLPSVAKSTDANGWTVFDMGNFYIFTKSIGLSIASISAGSTVQTVWSDYAPPVAVSDATNIFREVFAVVPDKMGIQASVVASNVNMAVPLKINVSNNSNTSATSVNINVSLKFIQAKNPFV